MIETTRKNLDYKINFKVIIASVLFIFLILFSWKQSYPISCLAFMFPTIIFIIIASSYIEVKVKERECFKTCYFNDNSLIARFLSSRVMIILFYILSSIILSISLLYSIIDFTYIMWSYLIVHVFLVLTIYNFTRKTLQNTLNQKHLMVFSREITITISSIILFCFYAYYFINMDSPLYLEANLQNTIQKASNIINSNCEIISYFLKLKIELDAFLWWTMEYSTGNADNILMKNTILILFIFVNALAVIAINRFIVQVVYLTEKILKIKNEENINENR